jgi:hypothetical protein
VTGVQTCALPIFETCRQQAYQMRISQAVEVLDAVRIGAELERLGLKVA